MKQTLTYSEWMVMSALWGREPQTLSEVISIMGETMDWSYRTYATYLRTLCEKGFAGFELRGRDKFYFALIGREECMRAESRSLIQKVSERGAKELLVCMIEESGLTGDEHGELKDLIEALIKKEGNT